MNDIKNLIGILKNAVGILETRFAELEKSNKVQNEPVMEIDNSPSGVKILWEKLVYGRHLLYIEPQPPATLEDFTAKDLDTIRQWYNAVEALVPTYLNNDEFEDREVFAKVTAMLELAKQKDNSTVEKCVDALKKFKGLPPYDHPGNIVRSDSIFSNYITEDFGAEVRAIAEEILDKRQKEGAAQQGGQS